MAVSGSTRINLLDGIACEGEPGHEAARQARKCMAMLSFLKDCLPKLAVREMTIPRPAQ